jgi:hypothetical protein
MITLSSKDDYAEVPVGQPFYFQYHTAAHVYESIRVSRGIKVLNDGQITRNTDMKPGSFLKHQMTLRIIAEGPQYIDVVTKSPIPSAETHSHTVWINKTCSACGVQEPIWKCQSYLFCSRECAASISLKLAEEQVIHYLSTGYFDGRRIDLQIRKSAQGYTFVDRKQDVVQPIIMSRKDGDDAWRLAQEYARTGIMHPTTDADHPRCCDIGTTRIFFRDYAVEPGQVPELVQIFEKYK